MSQRPLIAADDVLAPLMPCSQAHLTLLSTPPHQSTASWPDSADPCAWLTGYRAAAAAAERLSAAGD